MPHRFGKTCKLLLFQRIFFTLHLRSRFMFAKLRTSLHNQNIRRYFRIDKQRNSECTPPVLASRFAASA
jgi:hypothetical protein